MLNRRGFFGMLAGAVGALVAGLTLRRKPPVDQWERERAMLRTLGGDEVAIANYWPGRIAYTDGTTTWYNKDGSVAKALSVSDSEAEPLTFRGIPIVWTPHL